MSPIEKLAEQVGFHNCYKNNLGEQVYASKESRRALLKAMGYQVDNNQQIEASLERLSNEPWLRLLPCTQIIKAEEESNGLLVTINEGQQSQLLNWKISTEYGEQLTGSVALNDLSLVGKKIIDGIHYYQYTLPLPKVPLGYHKLEALTADNLNKVSSCFLIVAPKSCYGPKDVSDDKMWGLAAQLYSLKSDHSWGIGDFSDLEKLVIQAAAQGASTIGLNPLHPLFPGNTAHRSPYSPTSRNFLNTIYIDVTKVANYEQCEAATQLVNSADFKARLEQANQSALIDYPLTAALKYEVLELLYRHFVEQHLNKATELSKEFEQFRAEFTVDLKVLATFDALYEHFREKDFNAYGWMSWPVEYQDPNSAAVKEFQAKHSYRVGYFEFIQWLADQQLANIERLSKQNGMQIGLYLDLAVGCDGGGADVWANRSVYVAGGSVGAPPDATNLLGQDWGLTPVNPLELIKQGFQPLVKALRSNMRHAGALRIDHVLGYMRQYWVAPGMKADQGIYISFPFEDMLRVIALESRRAECIVIGEDLGTTPEGFGEIMAAAGLLSYRLLFFERWESGLFKSPENYPEQSMVTVSTHDLPTLAGWWTGIDLAWREKLGLYPNENMGLEDRNNRKTDREQLILAMLEMKLLDQASIPSSAPAVMNEAFSVAVQRFLAKAPSRILLIPLEDALGLNQQVNIPGTIDEHPNWLQRLSLDIDEIWLQTEMKNFIEVMHQERQRHQKQKA